MNQNTAKITAGIRALAHKPNEIVSGTVVAGSVDMTQGTMTVQPSDDSEPIAGVLLNSISGNTNGFILYPADNSNVIIGTIDGPGEWVLLRASVLVKATLHINHVSFDVSGSNIAIKNGGLTFNISDSKFKMSTSGESLFKLLKDLFTYLTHLTVSTGAGTSSVPVNVGDFNSLLSRLDNLLTS